MLPTRRRLGSIYKKKVFMKGLQDKTVLITGALGGIGRATIQAFNAYNVQLILIDIVAEDKYFLDCLKNQAVYFQVDIAQPEHVDQIYQQILKQFPQIDFLIHTAGVYQHIELDDLDFATWNQQINLNLNANYYLIKSFKNALTEDSAIVNIASIAGHQGSLAHTAYATAKGGVVALSKSLAIELAPKTRVNTVSPGLIDTQMMQGMTAEKRRDMTEATPLQRLGQPHEIADVILFLCSQGASFMTGENIHVNGGLYRH